MTLRQDEFSKLGDVLDALERDFDAVAGLSAVPTMDTLAPTLVRINRLTGTSGERLFGHRFDFGTWYAAQLEAWDPFERELRWPSDLRVSVAARLTLLERMFGARLNINEVAGRFFPSCLPFQDLGSHLVGRVLRPLVREIRLVIDVLEEDAEPEVPVNAADEAPTPVCRVFSDEGAKTLSLSDYEAIKARWATYELFVDGLGVTGS